jgi:hypothetical protein
VPPATSLVPPGDSERIASRPSSGSLQLGDIDFLRRTLDVSRQVQRCPGGFEVRARRSTAVNAKCSSPRHWCRCSPSTLPARVHRTMTRRRGSSPERLMVHCSPIPWITAGELSEKELASATASGSTTCGTSMPAFYASGLIAAGCNVVTVQRALGHASASVTHKHGQPPLANGGGPNSQRRRGTRGRDLDWNSRGLGRVNSLSTCSFG